MRVTLIVPCTNSNIVSSIVGINFSIVVIKFVLFLVIRKIPSPSAGALAMDHRNDVISNIVALAMGFVGKITDDKYCSILMSYQDVNGNLC